MWAEQAFALQEKIIEHIFLTSLTLLFASVIAIPLGIWMMRHSFFGHMILKLGSVSQTIPSLAMLAFLVPFVGLGTTPTLIVLTFYAIYPLLRSTYTGLRSVPTECIEAANGLGFSNWQRLWIVELPLALPVIISGLRLATAMTIGIATIAAFIGAGGLGDFIMQGLSLNNSSLILLGAIPTALLALLFDYGISQIEGRLQHRKRNLTRLSSFQKLLLILLALIGGSVIGTFLVTEFTNKRTNSIVIASKNFTEQYILAELMAQLIEAKTSLKVIRKFNLGTTEMIHQAMLKGEVDLYPEYSGTAYVTILKRPLSPEQENIFEKVCKVYQQEFKLVWLEPFGFSNSQSLAISAEYAQNYHIHSLSDLAQVSSTLTIAAPPEFLKRSDALPGLRQVYGLTFRHILQVDPSLMYVAIENKKADVIAAFTTDGKLQRYNLTTLGDDKKFYPSYEAAPLIRESILKAYPQIYHVLAPLFGFITQEKMRGLNYQVDGEGWSPAKAARRFLLDGKLL